MKLRALALLAIIAFAWWFARNESTAEQPTDWDGWNDLAYWPDCGLRD